MDKPLYGAGAMTLPEPAGTVDGGLARLEREFIRRGYRILYRRPDEHCIITYQLAKDGATMGFRMTEQLAAGAHGIERLVDKLEKEWR